MSTDKSAQQAPLAGADAWQSLRQFTDARIAMGRSGSALPTRALLNFQWDHACARDAVHQPLDFDQLSADLESIAGVGQILRLQSLAENRHVYLQRPDLGRQLDPQSLRLLAQQVQADKPEYDLAIVIADGLSSAAVQRHSAELVRHLLPEFQAAGIKPAPLVLVSQGRVAAGDQIAEVLGCRMLVTIIGERPGLSSPDSLGIYYTYNATAGTLDSARNCISNVRPAGLAVAEAVNKLLWLVRESDRIGLSGVELKDETPQVSNPVEQGKNFLLPVE